MSVNLLLILFVLVVVAMIAFILVQKGAGATAGSAFGSGASSTVFGAKGSGNFLTKTTMTLAFLFFAISMFMAVEANKEFAVADTGEVDLGVMGTLDTSNSDVPSITPAAGDATPESDIPAIDEKTVIEETVGTEAEQGASETSATDVIESLVDGEVEKVKENTESTLQEVKTEAVEKVKETVKDSTNN